MGLLISKTLPTAVEGMRGVGQWHYFAAALSIILTGVHIGLHASSIRRVASGVNPLPRKISKAFCLVLAVAVFACGSYSMVTGSFVRWLSGSFLCFPKKMQPVIGKLSCR